MNDLYLIWWLTLAFQCLPTEARQEIIEDVMETLEFYEDRANFNPPPLVNPEEIEIDCE